LEAVRLVREQGISIVEASRDLDVHENVLRKWVWDYENDPAHAFPGQGQQKPEQAEIAELKRAIKKLKAEHDILKKGRYEFNWSLQHWLAVYSQVCEIPKSSEDVDSNTGRFYSSMIVSNPIGQCLLENTDVVTDSCFHSSRVAKVFVDRKSKPARLLKR